MFTIDIIFQYGKVDYSTEFNRSVFYHGSVTILKDYLLALPVHIKW